MHYLRFFVARNLPSFGSEIPSKAYSYGSRVIFTAYQERLSMPQWLITL
jgi:hypothetical protein